MALIHEELYESKDFSNVNFKVYIQSLANNLQRSHGVNISAISLDVIVEDVSLDIDNAIPVGLIVNELLTNSFKYAFPDNQEGNVIVSLKMINTDMVELIVKDNGISIPKEMDIRKTKYLGLEIVTGLAEKQLGGSIELNREGGTAFRILFKKIKEKKKF